MNELRQKIHNIIKNPSESNSEVVEAFQEIVKIQKGGNLLKSGIPSLDYFLISGLSNQMVFIGARPAQGKTFQCERIIKNLLDNDLNNDNLAILRLNWEMQTKSLLLRSLKKHLNKSMRNILSKPFEEEEKNIVKQAVNEIRDKRITNISDLIEADDFRFALDLFCSKNRDKEKIVLVDHLHILPDKPRIDAFLGICNEYKKKYPKLGFIIFFQLNRELENLWRGKDANPRNFRPNSKHIYNTDSLYQYADCIMTLVIPEVVNLENYAVVNKKYCENLLEHFLDENSDSNWVKLKGRNRLFIDFIKIRMADDFEDPRLYCEILNNKREETLKEEDGEELEESMPAFMKKAAPEPSDEGGVVQKEMFGERGTEEDDDLPF